MNFKDKKEVISGLQHKLCAIEEQSIRNMYQTLWENL